MSGSVNKVILLGRCGKDPEVRVMQDGSKVVNLTIATSERWKDKQSGEQKEKVEWSRIVIWNEHLATVAEKYLKKGSMVYLEGALQTRKWAGQDGVEKYATEIVLARFKGELKLMDAHGNGGGEFARQAPAVSSGGGGGKRGNIPDLDDEIPFVVSDEMCIGFYRFGKHKNVF